MINMYQQELFERFIKKLEMDKTIEWFVDIFYHEMIEEGWTIITGAGYYQVCYINKQPIDDECIDIVKQYGWDVSRVGYIKDFDIHKLTRNKHLIVCTELGLL
jgi:hypothetical protein